MATIDHLFDKFHPDRAYVDSKGKPRTVLSCKKCNNERSNNIEKRGIPIEDLWKKSGRYPKKLMKENSSEIFNNKKQ